MADLPGTNGTTPNGSATNGNGAVHASSGATPPELDPAMMEKISQVRTKVHETWR
jgi:hypothetical protein